MLTTVCLDPVLGVVIRVRAGGWGVLVSLESQAVLWGLREGLGGFWLGWCCVELRPVKEGIPEQEVHAGCSECQLVRRAHRKKRAGAGGAGKQEACLGKAKWCPILWGRFICGTTSQLPDIY